METNTQNPSGGIDYTIGNFVGVFKNAFSKQYCETVIDYYEKMVLAGHAQTRFETEQADRTVKDDSQVYCDEIDYLPLRIKVREFNEIFWGKCYPIYEREYSVIKESARHTNFHFKLQKTKIGGGYHIWHYESGAREYSNRLLAWILYLNDVHEGGETEFLYQHMRIKPEQGTLVMWPAAFTHTHRGNPPLSNEKYIVTGWTEF